MPDQPLTPEEIETGLRLADQIGATNFARALRQLQAQAVELERLRGNAQKTLIALGNGESCDPVFSLSVVAVRVQGERNALARFKAWVHDYLDAKGVPTHPDGPHGAEGCRIGDRMDFVFAEMERQRTHNPCPCLHTTPCNPMCTCRQKFSSYGCARCCSYGNAEQQKATAEYLAGLVTERDASRAARARLAAMLTKYQWGTCHCPCCDGMGQDGHEESCEIATLLADARAAGLAGESGR